MKKFKPLFGQILDKIGLLDIPASGHTFRESETQQRKFAHVKLAPFPYLHFRHLTT